MPGILQAQTVIRHTVSAEVQALVSIREAQLAITDSTRSGHAWTWTGSVTGNAPFALQVQGPGRAAASMSARIAGGSWIRLLPDEWHTIRVSPSGIHRLVVDLRVDDDATTSTPQPPAVRAVSR
jgi:hypothetical protein